MWQYEEAEGCMGYITLNGEDVFKVLGDSAVAAERASYAVAALNYHEGY